MEKRGENPKFKCAKCGKEFKKEQYLRYHVDKKIPCDRILKCPRCNKTFKNKGHLNKHLKRKTPCEPILGNTQKPLKNPLTCHFCYRTLASKYSLKRHFNTCQIRNGNMPMLFEKIKEDQQRYENLDSQIYQDYNPVPSRI